MSGSFEPISLKPGAVPRADWEWVPLSAVARLESGHTPSRRVPEYWEGGTIPWLSLKDIRRRVGMYVYETADQPTQLGIDNSSARVLPAGTVALCRTASVGKVAVLGRAMATSQDFVNWVCGPRLLPEYLYHALMCSSRFFDAQKEGSTHKTIYFPTVQKFHVLLPPLPEQKRIAAILDKADEIRRKRQEAIRLTEELLRSAFLEMFGDPVTNPKGWEVADGSQAFAELKYGSSEKCEAEASEGVPVLRIPNVVGGLVSWENLKYSNLSEAEVTRLLLARDDLLFVRSNGNPDYIGRCAVFEPRPGSNSATIFASYLIRARLATGWNPQFLQAQVTTGSFREVVRREAQTTAGNYNISTVGLRKLTFIRPPVDLQKRYAVFAQSLRARSATLADADALVRALQESLATRVFQGGA